MTQSIAFFSQLLPNEVNFFILLLFELGQFGPLILLEAVKIVVPGIFKEVQLLKIGCTNGTFLMLVIRL